MPVEHRLFYFHTEAELAHPFQCGNDLHCRKTDGKKRREDKTYRETLFESRSIASKRPHPEEECNRQRHSGRMSGRLGVTGKHGHRKCESHNRDRSAAQTAFLMQPMNGVAHQRQPNATVAIAHALPFDSETAQSESDAGKNRSDG